MKAFLRSVWPSLILGLFTLQCRIGYEAPPAANDDSQTSSANAGVSGSEGGVATYAGGSLTPLEGGEGGTFAIAGSGGADAGSGGAASGGAGGALLSASCTDSELNGDETSVDCGGPSCPRCEAFKTCSVASDCHSGICDEGSCREATCSDAVKNGGESDVDCGGPCTPCGGAKACSIFSDCESEVCEGVPTLCQAPSCADGVRNGGESDRDCGGATSCSRCERGASCNSGADCSSGTCSGGVCQAPATCTDSLKNGTETAVDCGGSSCPKCGGGSTCSKASDCTSGVCSGTCSAPSCTDGIRNGTETGVDCGGSCPSCTTPVGLRVAAAVKTTAYGGTGGVPFVDMCPHDQVVIGFTGYYDSADPVTAWLKRLQTVCGVLKVSSRAPFTVSITPGATLPVRGAFGTDVWTRMCPAGQVVTGFSGSTGYYVDALSFECRPLVISGGTPNYTLSLGVASKLATIGGIGGEPVPLTPCAAGQIARGVSGRSGSYLDMFSLTCGVPRLTFPTGSACSDPASCESGSCSAKVCASSTCTSSSSCACAQYGTRDYKLCASALTYSAAVPQCSSAGMRLTRVDDEMENAWLRSTANTRSINSFLIGATDFALTGFWSWENGTQFYTPAGPVGTLYHNWAAGYPSGVRHTAQMMGDGTWQNKVSTQAAPFVCERY